MMYDNTTDLQEKIMEERRRTREIHWYVLSVKLFHEKRLADNLQKMGYEIYLPVKRELRQWSDRKKWVDVVLVPRMIFIRISLKDKSSVFIDKNVLSYMSAPGTKGPAPIPDEQMHLFMSLTQRSESEIQFLNEPLKVGDKVTVLSGALIGLEGELTHVEGESKLFVRLNNALSAEVKLPADMVEKLLPVKK